MPVPENLRPVLSALLLLAPGATAAQEAATLPLFASHAPLEFTLYADFEEIRDNRNDTITHDAKLEYTSAGGDVTALELKLWVRGNFRRQKNVCSFPPLRLDFDKDDENLGVFAGQNRIKMVVHCRDNDDYEQYVLREYLAYRIYGELTERSFRARLAHVTYVDESGDRERETRWAFLLEDDDDVAARLGGEVLDLPQVDPRVYDAQETARMDIFQYMIGNTDLSSMALHNVVPVQTATREYYAIPYDFDWSGLVSARYARPDERLGLRNVRQRQFRGFCREGLDWAPLYAHFAAGRAAVEALVRETPGLSRESTDHVLSYLDEFYRTVENPGRAEREFERACRRITN